MKLGAITKGANSIKTFMKSAYAEAKEIYNQNNVFKETRAELEKIRHMNDYGTVDTEGIVNDKARQMVDTSKSGLEAYAKSRKLNITFRTPESGEFETPLAVTVERKEGLFKDPVIRSTVIDGNPEKITKFEAKGYLPDGAYIEGKGSNRSRIDKQTADETFLRRVYHTVSRLNADIEKEKWEDSHISKNWNI